MAAGSPEQARALPMLEYLLEEIQPSFGSSTQRKITAYENFTRFFFTAQPRYEQEHIELLLRGDKKTRGLMYCTGQVSFSKSLKKTAPKALALLARLLDEHENKDCVAFRTALLESSPALIKGLRLEKHLKGKKNSDAEAAEAVAAVLQQGKTSTREALPEEANEVLALKSSAAGPSAASHAQMMAAAKSAPAPAPQPRRAEATIDRSSQKGGFAAAWQVLTGFFKSRPTPKDMEKRGLLRTGRYFGARLDTVCRDHGSDGVPTILRVCFDRLRDFGIDEPGIFRVPGNTDDVQLLKKRFDYDDEIPEFGGFSCHTVAGLLKLYLRELPEPLMTFRRYDRFVNLYREENYQGIFDLVQELPPANCATMQYLIDELAYVSLHADENRMTPSNVAIVFSPNLLRPEVETYEAIARDTPATIGCLKVLIEDRCRKLTISKREKESKKALAAITSAEPAAAQPAPAPAAAAQSASTPSQTPPSTPPAHRGSLAPLPPPWVEYVDSSSGLCYFFNPETNVTQWERPGAPPPPPPSHLRTESTASSSPAPASSPPPSAPPSRQKRASILGPVGVEVLAREIADQSHAANLEMPDSSDDEAVYVDVDPETGVERTVVREDVQSSSTIPHMSAGSRQNRATTAAERAGASRPPVAKRESLMRVVVDDISVEDVDQMARFRSASRLVNVDDEEETNTGQHNEEPVVEEPEPEPELEVLSPADNSGLPPFWSEHIDPESGKIFYFNSNTQESSWVRPRADSQAPEPASVGLCGVVQSELVESGGMQVHQLFVTDQWTEDTAGGCHPNNHTWRSNPQYRLTVPPEGEGEQIVGVTLEMTLQVEPGTDTPPAIGVYIFRSGGSSARKLYVTDADHVARSEFSLLAKTTVQFEVSPTPHQYIVMPCTFHPGHAGTFSLNFSSDRQLTLEPIPHEQQWQEARMAGQWTEATAGGCRNNRTWEKNPQHLLSLPNSCTTATPVILVLSQPTSVGPPEAIGLYVVSKLGHIVAKAAFMHAPEVHCQVSLLPEAGPFIIVPCTFEPGKVRPYVLSAFSHAGITLIHTL